jgi:hypothetical protein
LLLGRLVARLVRSQISGIGVVAVVLGARLIWSVWILFGFSGIFFRLVRILFRLSGVFFRLVRILFTRILVALVLGRRRLLIGIGVVVLGR